MATAHYLTTEHSEMTSHGWVHRAECGGCGKIFEGNGPSALEARTQALDEFKIHEFDDSTS